MRQPWASLIARGEKTIEVRQWATPYRGPIVILAALRPATPPSGVAICLVDLLDCRRMTYADEAAAICRLELGAWAWVLGAVKRLDPPLAIRGRLGLFTLPAHTQERIHRHAQ